MESTITDWEHHAARLEKEAKKPVTEFIFDTVVASLAREINHVADEVFQLRQEMLQLQKEVMEHTRDSRDISVMPEDQEERYEKHGEDGRELGVGILKNRCQG